MCLERLHIFFNTNYINQKKLLLVEYIFEYICGQVL